MGMFDELRCEAALPDGFDCTDEWFQTKSFPDPFMQRYTITADGRLHDSAGNDCEPDGYITFYTSYPARAGGSDDMKPNWYEYRARFAAGDLQEIVRVGAGESARRYYGLASFRWFDAPSSMFGDPHREACGEQHPDAPTPEREPNQSD